MWLAINAVCGVICLPLRHVAIDFTNGIGCFSLLHSTLSLCSIGIVVDKLFNPEANRRPRTAQQLMYHATGVFKQFFKTTVL